MREREGEKKREGEEGREGERERENVAWAVRIDLAALRACRRLGSWRGPIGGLLLSLPLSRSLLFSLETYSRPPCPFSSHLPPSNQRGRVRTHTYTIHAATQTHARHTAGVSA